MKGFGIDFGTTNSLIAYYNADISHEPLGAFPDTTSAGPRPHPTLAVYKPDAAQPVVGWEARRSMNQAQQQMGYKFVHSVKRQMAEAREIAIIGTDRKPAREVGADILKFLIAHAHQSKPIAARGLESCVMSVPVYSSGAYRRELRRAAALAGLRVESFTHEPFAAVFGWLYQQKADLHKLPSRKVLVFDWGGGTLDITLVQIEEGRVYELGNSAMNDCAGDDFTTKLISLTRNKFLHRTKLSADEVALDAETKDRVWVNLEDAKINLSSSNDIHVNVPNFVIQKGEIYDVAELVTRSEYDDCIRADVLAAKSKVNECLQRAGLEPQLVDLVLLVGGTSKTPLVHQVIQEIFVSKVVPVQDADSIIAKGAALISAHKWKPYLVKPITVKLADNSYLPIFDHGQALAAPLASKTFTFFCTDGRNGIAHLLFHEQQTRSNANLQKSLNCNLSVPTLAHVMHVADLDRVHVNCYVTEDLTIRVEAMSSSKGHLCSTEIQDICYGLEINY